MFDGQNLWVLKPNDLNRGWGVELFSTIDDLKRLIEDYSVGVEVQSPQKPFQDLQQENGIVAAPEAPKTVIRSD